MSVRILKGDCRQVLAAMAAESVHCCVTSPPYFGLRDYGIAPTVWGEGSIPCQHVWGGGLRLHKGGPHGNGVMLDGGRAVIEAQALTKDIDAGTFCQHCGAWRGAHGLEPSIELYVRNAVEVFRAVHRVLRADGTCWINLGDSYATGTTAERKPTRWGKHGYWQSPEIRQRINGGDSALKPKDLCGIPWRIAFALQADGWWLRQDIIWAKPNPMPESITDRCTKAHEYLFLLSKSARYYFNADAIAEPASDNTHARTGKIKMPDGWDTGPGGHGSFHRNSREKGRLTDSTNESYVPGASPHTGLHRAGTPRGGRVPGVTPKSAPEDSMVRAKESWHASTTEVLTVRNKRSVWTVPTSPFPEAHFATFPPDLIEPCIKAGCPKGGTVLDPFFGAGTTGLVADRLQRDCIGIELNPDYIAMASRRIRDDAPLFAQAEAAE